MIFALGHVSGAYFNPAVSVGFGLGRHFPWPRVATYAVAQVGGAVCGALLLRATLGSSVLLGSRSLLGPTSRPLHGRPC
jgi:glycerol uptake facilitator-like aquaporin